MAAARNLALLYDQYVAAAHQGDHEIVDAFAGWLGAFWDAGPAEPERAPDAVSLLGGVGRGVRWYETDGIVHGYVRGWRRRGCYRVPLVELTPSARRLRQAA